VGLGLESWDSGVGEDAIPRVWSVSALGADVQAVSHFPKAGGQSWIRAVSNPFRELMSPLSENTVSMAIAAYLTGADLLPSVIDSNAPSSGENSRSGTWLNNMEDLPSTLEQLFSPGQVLGEGDFGRVQVVRARVSQGALQEGHQYALKLLNKQLYQEQNLLIAAYRERSILESTQHPCLVRLFAALQIQLPTPQWLLVMEYCKGGSLADRLYPNGSSLGSLSLVFEWEPRPPQILPRDFVTRCIAETLLGMEYLHSMRIVHRDLKSDNILLTANEHCKVADLGMARASASSQPSSVASQLAPASSATSCTSVIPPSWHRAPEAGAGSCDASIDLYSFGILLFELIAGNLNQVGVAEERTVVGEVVDVAPHLVAYLREMDESDVVTDLVATTVALDPDDRGSARELRDMQFFEDMDWESLLRRCRTDAPMHGWREGDASVQSLNVQVSSADTDRLSGQVSSTNWTSELLASECSLED